MGDPTLSDHSRWYIYITANDKDMLVINRLRDSFPIELAIFGKSIFEKDAPQWRLCLLDSDEWITSTFIKKE